MPDSVLVEKANVIEWYEERLQALANANRPLKVSFEDGCGAKDFYLNYWDEQKAKERLEKATSDAEKETIRREYAEKKEARQKYSLTELLEATGEKVGHLLRMFRIGDGETGYPAGYVKSQQWCEFFSKCPNLEEVWLISCYDADDAVVDSLKRNRKLRKLQISGNDKISGSVSNTIISRLCARPPREDDSEESEDGVESAKEEDWARAEHKEDREEAQEVKSEPAPEEGFSSTAKPSNSPEIYFPALEHLILTDQRAIGSSDFDKIKAKRPDVRFCYGTSGGYTAAASMLGLDRDMFLDTHEQPSASLSKVVQYTYNDYFDDGDDFCYNDYLYDDDDDGYAYGDYPAYLVGDN